MNNMSRDRQAKPLEHLRRQNFLLLHELFEVFPPRQAAREQAPAPIPTVPFLLVYGSSPIPIDSLDTMPQS